MTDIVRIFKCDSKKYIKLFEYMLIKENTFIRNSNYYYILDYHSNSLSLDNMTIKTFSESNFSVMSF